MKPYIIFSILAISILVSVPFMHAYAQVTLLKINEIEFNPPGPVPGNQWIEIYNPSNVLLDLSGFLVKGTDLGRTIPVAKGIVIEPNGFVVIPFSGKPFDENGDSIILLTPELVEVDRTPLLTDLADDDRTWQRFPNGLDTENISDWHFRNSTFSVTNGFPVAKPNFTLSDPIFVDQRGNKAESFLQGQMVGVKSEILNQFPDERSFTYIIQIKNEEGFPLFIGWIEDIVVLSNRAIKPTIFFLAEDRGEYTVDVFVWRSMALSEPLTPAKHGLIRVAG